MRLLRLVIIIAVLSFAANLFAAEKLLTIVHTNDLHSHLQGFSPEIDYNPDVVNADATVGGWSRIATVIKETKKTRKNPVLTLDSGDYFMGSLFHMLAREEAFELRLLKAMGYDAVTLGNHEFDLKPAGLARILRSAKAKGGMPQIVFASAIFSKSSTADDSLEEAFKEVDVKDYTVLNRDGLKIGIFGIMGKDAAAVAPFAKPVTFRDPIEVSREMVRILRDKEKADIVICLSHSGLNQDAKKSEDEILARTVEGIDVIVSGHTHSLHKSPVQVGDTIIVHAWVYGKQVGILDIAYENRKVRLRDYKLVNINSTIKGDALIQKTINNFKQDVNTKFLVRDGWSYDKIIARTNWDLTITADESPVGNLIADSIRWYVNKMDWDKNDPASEVVVAVESNGVIRDNLLSGKTGMISVGDLFRTIPLGIGMDDTMGYPLISFYLYGYEIKRALEILTSVYPLKGYDYFLQISGLRFSYNPHRMIFDRVTDVETGSDDEGYKPLDYGKSNRRLYRVAANIYNATFLKVVGNYTYHFLDIVPKDKSGNSVSDLTTLRVDSDKATPGIQELKEWQGTIQYVQTFRDTAGDGLPTMPDRYKGKQGRIMVKPSWSPVDLISRAALPTTIAIVIVGVILIIIISGIALIYKRRQTKK
jgi:5''-nucleotidase/2'',3''-cyclic phosphodiesterase and related esterases